nr:hypothetical protein [Tanacetum cinerariifolium]
MGINEKLNNLLLQFNYLVADVNRLKGGKGSSRFSMLSKLEFPKFYGEDIQGWMFRVRQFFTLDGVHEEDKHNLELRPTKDFEAKYNKFKAKLALLSLSASASKASMVKNKSLIAEAYEWDKEEVSSDDNEMVEVKILMALAKDNDAVSKKGTRNDKWVKISMRKVHTLFEIEDNADRKNYLEYLCIDLYYVKEQKNNLLSKHKDLV